MSPVKAMVEGGRKLAAIRQALVAAAVPGIALSELEAKAQALIKAAGGEPSFSRVPGYKYATCINLNEGLVHGIPDDKVIADGDIVSIDVGLFFMGYNTDTSESFIAGTTHAPQKIAFLAAGRKALSEGIDAAIVGNRIGHISLALQTVIEAEGFTPAQNLTGHGIGKTLHEDPTIPCFVSKPISQTALIKPGMTLAVEAIYLAGSPETITDKKDGWTIRSADGKITAVFEETIVTDLNGPIILTKL